MGEPNDETTTAPALSVEGLDTPARSAQGMMMMRVTHHHATYEAPTDLKQALASHKLLWGENLALRSQLQETGDRAAGATLRADRLSLQLEEVLEENRQLKLENTELRKTIRKHEDTMRAQGDRIAALERDRDAVRLLSAAGEVIHLWFSYKCLEADLDETEQWAAVTKAASAVTRRRKQIQRLRTAETEKREEAEQKLQQALDDVAELERQLNFGDVTLTAVVGVKRARNKQSHVITNTVEDQTNLILRFGADSDGLLPPNTWPTLQPVLRELKKWNADGMLIGEE